MPKLPNKSLIFVVAIIGSIIFSNNIVEKVLLCASKVSFQKTDMIFNMDISYYMFTKPLIEAIIKYIMQFVILISAYITAFYIIVFNLYFDGIDRTMLRKKIYLKKFIKKCNNFSNSCRNINNIQYSKYSNREIFNIK